MSIDRIIRNNIVKGISSQHVLRPGQLVTGKIVKLFPGNKAQIQLGAQKMVAQLEASLTVGERYHFQVQAAADLIHLKVLGEQLKSEERINCKNLLLQLGLKATKPNISFMQTLINEKIPFDRSQLTNALRLLETSDKVQSQQVLKEMFKAKLPMTDSVFQALLAKATNGITDQMMTLLQTLKQDTKNVKLAERLSQMVERPLTITASLVKQIISECRSSNPHFFNLLKAIGTIQTSIDFSTWKSQWEAFEQENNIDLMHMSNRQLTAVKQPFQMNSMKIFQALEQMNAVKAGLQSQSLEILHSWKHKLDRSVTKNIPLTEKEMDQLKQQITQKIIPFFTKEQQQQITQKMQHDSLHLRLLLNSLETLSNGHSFTKVERLLKQMNMDRLFLLATPKEQFLTQINQTLQFTGLAYENQLINAENGQQSSTVKAMLLQMLQHAEASTQERGQQLLHFINGMQISAVNEVNNFIQASLQIPGERLGLNKDLELEFEGNKSSNGEINPDYCRIVFYLDLAQLKTTVIDMNVHKRAVTITIFNDTDHIKDQAMNFQPLLKTGLASLNYTLLSIAFKPLEQRNETEITKRALSPHQSSYKGVDYFI